MSKGYVICATPRTGSTLLCDLLASTKVAGDPDSFFMNDPDPVWAERWRLPRREGFSSEADFGAAFTRAVATAGRGGTEVFGMRLMRENLDDATALIGKAFPGLASDKARLQAAFGSILYIHLAREDKLAQAVSMIKAEQTGLWHAAPDGTEIERLAPPKEPEYDFHRITRKVAQLERFDDAWVAWFDRQGIEPLRVGYERLSANPAETLTGILEALRVRPPDLQGVRPGVAKLADAVSLEWMNRYRRELQATASR